MMESIWLMLGVMTTIINIICFLFVCWFIKAAVRTKFSRKVSVREYIGGVLIIMATHCYPDMHFEMTRHKP